MAIAIKSTSDIARKFAEVTPGRVNEYADGVANPKRDWEAETRAAEDNYVKGIQNSIRDKRFGKGVAKAGTAKWRERAMSVGPGRFAEGVAAAGPAYEAGFDPFRNTIAGLTLPPRGPTGDPRNIDRVKVIAEALHKKKLAG
ncbi:hypothetical protein ES708_21263 [subsurface metagenome]